MTSDNLMKLQGLFRELFQLDTADLDFGLYRLFNIKRQEIEDFLTKQLPDEVDEAFRILSERDKADFREGLQKLEEQIRGSPIKGQVKKKNTSPAKKVFLFCLT